MNSNFSLFQFQLIDSQPTSLPWLENNKLEKKKIIPAEAKEEKENIFGVPTSAKNVVIKQYQSGMYARLDITVWHFQADSCF